MTGAYLDITAYPPMDVESVTSVTSLATSVTPRQGDVSVHPTQRGVAARNVHLMHGGMTLRRGVSHVVAALRDLWTHTVTFTPVSACVWTATQVGNVTGARVVTLASLLANRAVVTRLER